MLRILVLILFLFLFLCVCVCVCVFICYCSVYCGPYPKAGEGGDEVGDSDCAGPVPDRIS